ncbi:RluA family pseudouridine synthase [Aneurinibacillus aneurinilyticus]|jgi:tRNA pseudouridine32 synthase/23S rRNA pseudouridine746 synthase/23S rRNA pseudouridine1911/1915/1917 synthase|uniref:Pseudouridine synthase n=2 Tax=Aneurinibacillus aneurinilyticus TaxID=1391 RepID=A0A848D0Q4_ANEAE|nr:RluA family pseudouridine synthase [Aneurinibacillus aneurinilyticus]ERI08481.1 pseudouridine synthase, RluA family [Aneurinibacillus aneurinilyticus ATCC 12856]MCI1696653.1 RluA family pseudouridine synthase [Aneurinibacillus aneurinilyticus]MED0668964.1 RluA family pseudouridine synthase [Aneurinibacillus aneurinilyticus]MED0707257.1 RluA family pseudouridine synthase [Aneurinibacillus aneurinilyticus]MED0726087.1 RluA family pseudouridine synthase [Aneurinibacillus aneurinilyticus]
MASWKIDGKWLEYEAEAADAGLPLELILKERLSVSGRMLQRLTRKKGLFLNRKQPFLKKKIQPGDRIRLLIADAPETTLSPVEMNISVLYEDDAVLVVNKPSGLAVHPVKEGQNHTLAHGIAYYWKQGGKPRAVRPVHRLDKDTSGAVLIACNSFIHQLLDKQLRKRTIRRTYLALISGHPGAEGETDTITGPIARDSHHPTRRRVHESGDEAVTHYRVMECFPAVPGILDEGASLVEVELETGRTHQIRVHFSHLGFPLVGDTFYGGVRVEEVRRQALHAARLEFDHPVTGKRQECTAPLPEDMERLLARLRQT